MIPGQNRPNFLSRGISTLKEEGAKSFLSKSAQTLNRPIWNSITSRYPIGTNIFDYEWDLLIVLDACRVDALRHLAGDISFLDNVGRIWSVGSMSAEWMLNTYSQSFETEISNTALISRNNWSDRILIEQIHKKQSDKYMQLYQGFPKWTPVSSEAFQHYELVRGIANHETKGLHPEANVVPHIATDRAISIGRQMDCDRMIVHYNAPHMKYVSGALEWQPDSTNAKDLMDGPKPNRELLPEEKSRGPAMRGEVSKKRMFDLYLRELRFILDYVEILLSNFDGETVIITADHGEAFGEFGVWGHPFGWPLPPVKTVPWIATSAQDEETYESRFTPLERRPTDEETVGFLEEMGYI